VRYRNCHIDHLVTRATLLARYGPVSGSVYMSLSQTEFYRNGLTNRVGFLFSVFEFEYLFKKHVTNVHATELKAVSTAMVQKVK